MFDPDTLDTPANTAQARERRRSGRVEAALSLVPLLRHASGAVDMPQSQPGAAWPEFTLGLEDAAPAGPPLPTDTHGERSLMIQIVAIVCAICLAVAALSP